MGRARPPFLFRHAIRAHGVATLRAGFAIEGVAVGDRIAGSASSPLLEIAPLSVGCADLRLTSRNIDDELIDEPLPPKNQPVMFVSNEPTAVFSSPTSTEFVRVLTPWLFKRLSTRGERTEIFLRTRAGTELRGWVARSAIAPAEGDGYYGYGRGSMCGCGPKIPGPHLDTVLPSTDVYARPGGEPWGKIRLPLQVSVGRMEGEWVEITATPSYSEGDCEGEGVEHFWVKRLGLRALKLGRPVAGF